MRFLAFLLLAAASYAETRFITGQGARLVIGQSTFTAQEPGVSDRLLGGVSGVAYANDMLFVTDANRVNATPVNHRVLIFKNISRQFPGPEDELPFTGERCPVCVGKADVVLGQSAMDKGDLQPPRADTLRLPIGVASDGIRLAVADTDNNRVLIWNSIPTYTGQPADVVVGQPDFQTAVSTGFHPNQKSVKGPQGVWIQDGRLFVADTGNNRVLIWNSIPTVNNAPADVVLGAPDFNTFVQPDLTKAQLEPKANTLLTPVSVTSDGQRLYVADLGHNRVLIWNSIPTTNQAPADIVIGQPNFETAIANNAPALCEPAGEDEQGNKTYPKRCAATLEFPRFALSDGNRLFIADGGNDRILIFDRIPTSNGARADVVIGQVNEFVNNVSDSAFPDDVASAGTVRTPMSLAWDGRNLYASDPFNRRVLVFTLSEQRVATTGVRNAASLDIFAVGVVTVDGTPAKDQEVTVVIQEQREYTYKVKDKDDLAAIVNGLAAAINAGEGDPEVFATPNTDFKSVILTSKIGGAMGNNIKYSVKTSEGATLVVNTEGATLKGGGEATKIAPGTIISIIGENLADHEESLPFDAKVWPRELGGVQVYVDGIPAPVFYVSPRQINAQMPLNVFDAQGASVYVRTRHADGRVVASNAIAVPIIQFNPGIFAEGDTEPRQAVALHSSSHAMGVVSVDGQAKAGDTATVIIGDPDSDQARRYTYTVKAEDVPAEGEPARLGLEKIRDGLVELINQDPEVQAFPAGIFATRIRLEARTPGPAGNGIRYSAESKAGSGDASVILTATTPALCCANEAGTRVTADNPAIAGEIITVYATGLGIVQPEEARQRQFTGEAYDGPELNEPVEFVSSLCGGRTANVLASGLVRGMIGVFRVDLQLNSGLPTNPKTQCTIAQGFQVSNVVTVPVFNPNPEQ
jgi:uncharacterized protein (TIGR03437 family)